MQQGASANRQGADGAGADGADSKVASELRLLLDRVSKLPAAKPQLSYELELRFGTLERAGVSDRIMRTTFDRVTSWLHSVGYEKGEMKNLLRVSSSNFSNVRIELLGVALVKEYCKHEDAAKLMGKHTVSFVQKERDPGGSVVEIPNYNCRLVLSTEEIVINNDRISEITTRYSRSQKQYRYVCRRTYHRPGEPYRFELSVTRQSNLAKSLTESNVFSHEPRYEIEVEFDMNASAQDVKRAITTVASGMQASAYPIGVSLQASVLREFYQLAYKTPPSRVDMAFIGPQPVTLQMSNIEAAGGNSQVPNIRNNYNVTEKADGDRKLLYVNTSGRAYFINGAMEVQYTGTSTAKKLFQNTVLDGEHVTHGADGEYINLYLAFDVYYAGGSDKRSLPFYSTATANTRHVILREITKNIDLKKDNGKVDAAALTVRDKRFLFSSPLQTIFQASSVILEAVANKEFQYETDGLIFTPNELGAGATAAGQTVETVGKRTWFHAFKWKPQHLNTIDFLVTTKKTDNQRDLVSTEITSTSRSETTVVYYKTLQLRVSFNEHRDGIVNACGMIRNGAVHDKQPPANKDNIPALFFPDNPSMDTAHICNSVVTVNEHNMYEVRAENGDVVSDRTVVECRYDASRPEKWQWVIMRVRHDKTSLYRSSERLVGPNSFGVANNNWQTIHDPITQRMITTGANISSSGSAQIYYAATSTKKSRALRDFHNRFVKQLLIRAVSSVGDTLIDMAVGRGGDLPKWRHVMLSFVLGVDIDEHGITNRVDGACTRYVQMTRSDPGMKLKAIFVRADTSKNLKDGSATYNDTDHEVVRCLFGGANAASVGAGVSKSFGVLEKGADTVSIQFATHYMFGSLASVYNLVRNFSECVKIGGHVIGTTYDGVRVFELLRHTKVGEDYVIHETDGTDICRITREFESSKFPNDSGSIGFPIVVHQDTIGHAIREYLVNFEFFGSVMEEFGFVSAESFSGLDAIGSFERMHRRMLGERESYGDAAKMSAGEKELSFLNNYFIYKKVREVDEAVVMNAHAIHPRGQKEAAPVKAAPVEAAPTEAAPKKYKLKLKRSVPTKKVTSV